MLPKQKASGFSCITAWHWNDSKKTATAVEIAISPGSMMDSTSREFSSTFHHIKSRHLQLKKYSEEYRAVSLSPRATDCFVCYWSCKNEIRQFVFIWKKTAVKIESDRFRWVRSRDRKVFSNFSSALRYIGFYLGYIVCVGEEMNPKRVEDVEDNTKL